MVHRKLRYGQNSLKNIKKTFPQKNFVNTQTADPCQLFVLQYPQPAERELKLLTTEWPERLTATGNLVERN